MGFEVIKDGKGIYIDGHERYDVVEYRKLFLHSMVRLGFLNNQNAPTPEAAQCLPSTSACDSQAIQSERKVFIFHDESIFNTYDDQKVQWGRSDMQTIRPKGKGSGIMVSDFIEESMGFLNFSDDSGKKNIARVLLEYGGNREGYWTSEKFLQ